MEETVVLQVILHGDEGLEIRLGSEDKTKNINPLMLVGILEQVKLNVLSGSTQEEPSKQSEKPKYDA